ncbi:MAG: MFS transporter [Bdellovibrionales bacterium]|nr:MFS transporter [Bdellovibrionales bacterium]
MGKYAPRFTRQLVILLVAQAIMGSTVPVLFLISGLMGPKLSPSLKLSTLPMSLVIVGVALASPLAAWVMSKIGRRSGHFLGLGLTLVGVAVSGLGLWQKNFWVYCLACALCGTGSAFNNQIRFTAAESASDDKALVHSWVLMFSLFAAFLGPWIAQGGQNVLPYGEYTGSSAILFAVLALLGILMLALPKLKGGEAVATGKSKIRVRDVLKQGKFWVSALSGTASFATMTLLMSATPLQMNEVEKFSISETTMTIQSHIAAMFLPSLFSGVLLSWLGIRKLIGLGVGLFLVCIAIAFQSHHFHHYWWALVLLGIGWNFLFLAGSTWVSQSYSGPERFVAQGANDALVYGTQSLASLAAGWLLFAVGWQTLVLIPLPLLLFLLIFVGIKTPKS